MRRTTLTHQTGPRQQCQQTRSLYIKPFQAFDMLKEKSIPVRETTVSESDFSLSLTVDRTALSPCIIASSSPNFDPAHSRKFPFSYATTDLRKDANSLIEDVASDLGLPETLRPRLAYLVQILWKIFREKEAFLLEVRVQRTADGRLEVHDARFGFDDAAYRSSGRQEDVHRLRNKKGEVPEEVEAEKDGIVYVKFVSLPPSHHRYIS